MKKLTPKNTKKHKLSIEKQKLIDKINSCKSLSEIKEYKRTLSYHDVLKDDQDWDYGFFISLIEFKLKRMSQYFHTHNIVENEDWYGTLCDRAIAILNAGYKTNIILSEDLGEIKVNTKNVHRFFNIYQLEFLNRERLQKYYLATVREKKAKALFWKFLYHYIEYLWD
jgi:hypothetical protein